jgi:hypothetical protein
MKFKIPFLSLLTILTMFTVNPNSAVPETPSQTQCDRLRDEIENDFKNANFCEKDADCKVVQLGGWYIDFGCYKYVNASTKENVLLDKISKYKDEMKCSTKINDCMHSKTPVCVNKKCTSQK